MEPQQPAEMEVLARHIRQGLAFQVLLLRMLVAVVVVLMEAAQLAQQLKVVETLGHQMAVLEMQEQ
jgi:hypothetical protein